jgi:hypothetical protein
MIKRITFATLAFIALSQTPTVHATTTAIFGPQSWSNGSTTGRYRSLPGWHVLFVTQCSGSQTIELRVDVINNPDISVGYSTMTCGGANGSQNSSTDSYATAYRGHFMQSHSGFYGTLTDRHP